MSTGDRRGWSEPCLSGSRAMGCGPSPQKPSPGALAGARYRAMAEGAFAGDGGWSVGGSARAISGHDSRASCDDPCQPSEGRRISACGPIDATLCPGPPSHPDRIPSFANSIPSLATSIPSFATSIPSLANSIPSLANSIPSFATSIPSFANSIPSFATSIPSFATSIPSFANSIPSLANSIPSFEPRSRASQSSRASQTRSRASQTRSRASRPPFDAAGPASAATVTRRARSSRALGGLVARFASLSSPSPSLRRPRRSNARSGPSPRRVDRALRGRASRLRCVPRGAPSRTPQRLLLQAETGGRPSPPSSPCSNPRIQRALPSTLPRVALRRGGTSGPGNLAVALANVAEVAVEAAVGLAARAPLLGSPRTAPRCRACKGRAAPASTPASVGLEPPRSTPVPHPAPQTTQSRPDRRTMGPWVIPAAGA